MNGQQVHIKGIYIFRLL